MTFYFFGNFLLFGLLTALCVGQPHNHDIRKRQIGVLAKAGTLPQGKRAAEALIQNGELFDRENVLKKPRDEILNLFIDELNSAENIGFLKLEALSEKLREQNNRNVPSKRSVEALARNGELQRRKPLELSTRAGYLIKPGQEAVQPPSDLFDPNDFLGANAAEIQKKHDKNVECRREHGCYFEFSPEFAKSLSMESNPLPAEFTAIGNPIEKRFLGKWTKPRWSLQRAITSAYFYSDSGEYHSLDVPNKKFSHHPLGVGLTSDQTGSKFLNIFIFFPFIFFVCY